MVNAATMNANFFMYPSDVPKCERTTFAIVPFSQKYRGRMLWLYDFVPTV